MRDRLLRVRGGALEFRPAPSTFHIGGRVRLLCLAMISLLCLGCFVLSSTIEVTEGTGREGPRVRVQVAQELSPAYAQAAQATNQEMRADFADANVPLPPEWTLPTDVDAFREAFGVMFDPESMLDNYTLTADTPQREAVETTLSFSEYNTRFWKPDNSAAMRLDMDTAGGEVIRYVWELRIKSDEMTSDTVDWRAIDSLKTQFPSKPPMVREDPDKSGLDILGLSDEQRAALSVTGMDSMLSGALGVLDMSVAGADVFAWYALRTMRDGGFPQVQFRVTLPGKITAHTIDGEEAGAVSGNTVTFVLDDAYFRRHIVGNTTLRVDSEPLEEGEKLPTSEAPQPTSGGGQRFDRFRIRPIWSWSAGEIVGMGEGTYELQEIDKDGIPGRKCTIRFTGAGLTLGLPAGAQFSPKYDWTEFSTKGGPLSLEDFHMAKGSSSSAGAVVGGYGGFHFGTRDDRWTKRGEVKGTGVSLGIYAGIDWYHGHWEITEPPH